MDQGAQSMREKGGISRAKGVRTIIAKGCGGGGTMTQSLPLPDWFTGSRLGISDVLQATGLFWRGQLIMGLPSQIGLSHVMYLRQSPCDVCLFSYIVLWKRLTSSVMPTRMIS